MSNGHSQVVSTADVEPRRAFEYWHDLICDTFVQLAARPVGDRPFAGRIDHIRIASLDISTVTAGGQEVRRTPRLIARSDEAYLLASIQTAGRGLVCQGDAVAELLPGSLAFYDSTRPYTLRFDDAFEQIVVQVPLSRVTAELGSREPLSATARVVTGDGAGAVVTAFFRTLTQAQASDPAGAGQLGHVADSLLLSALNIAAGSPVGSEPAARIRRERALDYMRANLADPALDAERIAAALHISRRVLYRAFADDPDGVIGHLRRLRVERAEHLLRSSPAKSVRAIGAACGFAGEVQFHRSFKTATGRTPGEYRGTDRQ